MPVVLRHGGHRLVRDHSDRRRRFRQL